ncbi:MAG: lysophospholipase [Candidatus Helarchaeota archaeon]
MKHTEDYYKGAKGIEIYYQVWRPEDNPKAVVQIVHGIAEYSDRYINVVNALVPKGYIIYASDLQGHGKTKSLTGFVEKFDHYIQDQKILFDIIKEKEPGLPIFMLGHSMGSLIARIYAATYPEGLKGLILSGPGTKDGADISGFLRLMAKLVSAIKPKGTIELNLDPALISTDPEVVKAYKEDPKVFKKVTYRLGAELLKAFGKANKLTKNIKVPTLIQAGGSDALMLEADVVGEQLTVSDKTVKIYDGLYHEVYNEITEERDKVLEDLVNWLDSHL